MTYYLNHLNPSHGNFWNIQLSISQGVLNYKIDLLTVLVRSTFSIAIQITH